MRRRIVFATQPSSQQVIGENKKTQHRRQLVTVRSVVLMDRDFFSCGTVAGEKEYFLHFSSISGYSAITRRIASTHRPSRNCKLSQTRRARAGRLRAGKNRNQSGRLGDGATAPARPSLLSLQCAASSSAEDPCVPERIAAGLRVDAQPVRFTAHGDARQQLAIAGVDSVNLGVKAPGEPEDLAVR